LLWQEKITSAYIPPLLPSSDPLAVQALFLTERFTKRQIFDGPTPILLAYKEQPIDSQPKENLSLGSVFSPPVTAGHALKKACHRLISTANLNLEEGGFLAITSIGGALSRTLLRIVPGAGAAEDVFSLDTLVQSSREDRLGNVVFEGAGTALETVGSRICEGDSEDVCAMGAD
jgi:hypothetical protein